jgi:triosephosphate isomerase
MTGELKPKIRTPFFEIGIKNYIYGDKVLELALAADRASEKYDIDVLLIAPYTEIRRVAENTRNLIVLAPYMDLIRPGRGMADVLPEALKAAGAKGVVINHCERPMSLTAIKKTIDRANELDMLSFACADTIAEAKAIAQLHPDIINPEPTELIGSNSASDMSYVLEVIRGIKDIYPDILVEQAAGISSGKQIYQFICAGAEAAGSCSGIMNAADPLAMVDEMVCNVRKAYDVLKKIKGGELVK